MKGLKTKLSDVPREYWGEVFEELVAQRGVEVSKLIVQKDIPLSMAFGWMHSKRGHTFWELISEGRESEIPKYLKSVKKFEKEAEKRGFAVGVNTDYGVVTDGNNSEWNEEHDTFFYHNIKAYHKGVWTNVLPTTTVASAITGGGNEEENLNEEINQLIEALAKIFGK